MQKRIAALLLAVCLTLTCALGAWAEEPSQQPAGDAPVPMADGLISQEGSAPAENEDTPKDKPADTPATPVAEVEPAPAAMTGDELKAKLEQFDVTIAAYIGNDPVEGDNIAKSDTVTVYYLISDPHADACINTRPLEEIKAELGAAELSVYTTPGTGIGEMGEVYPLEVRKEIGSGGYAYFAQDITFTQAGQFRWTCGLTATDDGAAVKGREFTPSLQVNDEKRVEDAETLVNALALESSESTPALQVIDEKSAGDAETLANALTFGDVFRPGVDTTQQHVVTLEENFTLNLPVMQANGQPITDVRQYIQSLGLEPDKVKVEWKGLGDKADFIFNPDTNNEVKLYSGDGILGSKAFFVARSGRFGIEFTVLYNNELVKTITYHFVDTYQVEKETLQTAAAACQNWGSMKISIASESTVGFTGEPLVFLISFDSLAGMNDASVSDYLHRTTRDILGKDTFDLTTINTWYKDNNGEQQPVTITAAEGAVIYYPNMDDVPKAAIQNVGSAQNPDPKQYYVPVVCTPTQPGQYHLDIQFTSIKGDPANYPHGTIIVNPIDAKAVGMPCASIDFTVYDRPAVTREDVNVPENNVGNSDKAKDALVEAFGSEVAKNAELVKDIRDAVNRGEKITTELTIQPVTDPADKDLFTQGFAGPLIYQDIDINVKANDKVIGNITKTQTPIGFSFPMPDDGPIAVVLRSHAGEGVMRLPCWIDGGNVYFESDKFSTFAIGGTNSLAYAMLRYIAPQTYTGAAITPEVKIQNASISPDKYVVTYENNIQPGKGKVIVTPAEGSGLTGRCEMEFEIVEPAAPQEPSDGGDNSGGNGTSAAPTRKAPAVDEYIVCEACGYHFWEPYLEGWRCTTCGHLRGTSGVPTSAAAAGKTAYHGTIPQTADAFPLGGAAAAFGVSLAGLGALLLLRKKQR